MKHTVFALGALVALAGCATAKNETAGSDPGRATLEEYVGSNGWQTKIGHFKLTGCP